MVVGTPEVRTVSCTEVGFVTFGLVDPFPVEVAPEVDVERAQAASLVGATETQHAHTQTHTHERFNIQSFFPRGSALMPHGKMTNGPPIVGGAAVVRCRRHEAAGVFKTSWRALV